MELNVKPGKYVVAVSGGVDSMALLHALAGRGELDLIVAHFDHGIRRDSAEDYALVERAAQDYGITFVGMHAQLGRVSESSARSARYDFLQRVVREHNAEAIITAHHQDDVIETIILNMLRGTGRKGLSSLRAESIKGGNVILRPLLDIPKAQLVKYATDHKLLWREDSTNKDESYTRNYIRLRLVPRLSKSDRESYVELYKDMRGTNDEIDSLLTSILDHAASGLGLDRRLFARLPFDVSKELLASWLRLRGIREFDAKLIERVTVQAKVLRPGKRIDILGGKQLFITMDLLTLQG